MNQRVNKRKIYKNRSLEVSKTECETPEYMKRQRFSPKEIEKLQKKLEQWKKDHAWACKCGKINGEFVFNCVCCGKRKIFKL